MPRRTAGRVLLSATASADEPPRWREESEGAGRSRELDRSDVLVVTLLDNLVSQLGAHASPSLFGRLCRKLVDMKVLRAPCDLLAEDGGLDAVRVKYMEEFAELNDVFLKDFDKVRMDAEFTFSTASKETQPPGYALAKGITSAPPRPPTMPLPGRIPVLQREEGVKKWQMEHWETMGLEELLKRRNSEREESGADGEAGKKWHMLCPDAQMLLIADKPANADMSIAARLTRKQRSAKLGAERESKRTSEGLLNNSSSTTAEDLRSDSDGLHIPLSAGRFSGQPPLSMILPRRVLSDGRFAKMLPAEQSPLVEVQCKNFDLVPLFPRTSSAVTTIS